jgi:hypothetical protein
MMDVTPKIPAGNMVALHEIVGIFRAAARSEQAFILAIY